MPRETLPEWMSRISWGRRLHRILSTQFSITDANKAPLLNPPQLDRAARQMVLRSGRSWWMVRYADGRILHEWDTLQPEKSGRGLTGEEKRSLGGLVVEGFKSHLWLPVASQGNTSRWEDIPKRGMRGLYLVCPVGQPGVAALEANGDYLFFQLKVGVATINTGGSSTACKAHIIGKVIADNGNCICYAWEYEKGKITRFEDNVTNMAYEGIGRLNLDPVGLR